MTRSSGKKAQRRGDTLEQIAERAAIANGWTVQRITTPFRMVRGKPVRTHRVVGDLVGCTETGRAVLIECKSRQARKTKANPTGAGFRRPVQSDFEDHQIETLRDWDRRGAAAMVAWIDDGHLRFDRATDFFG